MDMKKERNVSEYLIKNNLLTFNRFLLHSFIVYSAYIHTYMHMYTVIVITCGKCYFINIMMQLKPQLILCKRLRRSCHIQSM